MDNDIAQLIQERDKLKGQNEQLWAIVNKQKELIKQLKMQQNIGDTTDSTEDMIHQMGRDSKPINARIEGPGEKEIRQQSNGHFVAVGPPSPFELDNRKEEGKASKLSSTENLSNPLSVEPPRLNLQMFGSQTLAGADSNSELKKSLILGTPINERIDSRDKSLGKSLNSISEEPSLTSALSTQLINDLKTLEPLFVKSMKKVVDSKIKIYYIFQLWSNGNTLCFVEKAQDDFENLRKALDSNHKDVPFLPENRLYALGATGNILQGWIKNVCNLYPQDTALSKFMNSSIIDQNDLRESFKKQGMLYKKGNYFGVWKARYYELDTATGTIFYSEQKGGESTGNFSLKYAYCGQYVPQAGDKQDEEYPGFVVTEYRKNFFAKQPDLEPRNADGLPSGKVEVRHVFHAESVDERDHWLRCISGVIARFRTDDRVAQYFFTLTTPPNPAELKSTRSSVKKNAEAKTEPKSEAKTEPRPETAKSEIKATSPSVAAPFSDTISPSMSMPDQISRVHTVKLKFNNNEETKTSPQRRNLSNGAIIPSGGVVDDQTRCLQQDFPPSLAQELPLKLVGKSAAETGKKKNNFFRDLIKRNTDSGQKQKFSIFGSTLKEATELTRISPNIDMPAIIYRCIEYVETKNRKFILTDYCEEGIYRLSGASSVIAALKTRFEEGFIY